MRPGRVFIGYACGAVAFLAVLGACAYSSVQSSRAERWRVELIAQDGGPTRAWETAGSPQPLSYYAGYTFRDASTGERVTVTGPVVLTRLSP